MADQIRLNKFLAERLGISRRQADDAISMGKVTVDGRVAKLGERLEAKNDIDFSSEVCYNGKIVPFLANFSYIELNKPAGYVCSRRQQGSSPTIYSLLPQKYYQLKPVGRLDRDSSGLILLTTDGDFAFKMTHPSFRKTKVYDIELDRELSPLHQQEISDFGIEIGDGVSKFELIRLDPGEQNDTEVIPDGSRRFFRVTMSEGRNRQIRRTFAALGYQVQKLHRIQFGNYQLGELAPGKFREISGDMNP